MSATPTEALAPIPICGTAHLYGAGDDDDGSGAVLDAAWRAGFRAFDTAPLYGHGRSETELGARLAHWEPRPLVVSKVGLEAQPEPSRGKRFAKGLARRLPTAVQERIRPADGGPHGDFDPDLVRWSVDRSLLRLGRLDRLMLHEVHAADLGEELIELLTALRSRGDVGQVGVATGNAEAGRAARGAPDLLTVAHVEIGPFAPPYDLPASVTTVVGHGVLGPAGSGWKRLVGRVHADPAAAASWDDVTQGTPWAGDAGLAEALVARAAAHGVSGVIVATSKPERLARLRELAGGDVTLPEPVAAALTGLITAERSAGSEPSPPTG